MKLTTDYKLPTKYIVVGVDKRKVVLQSTHNRQVSMDAKDFPPVKEGVLVKVTWFHEEGEDGYRINFYDGEEFIKFQRGKLTGKPRCPYCKSFSVEKAYLLRKFVISAGFMVFCYGILQDLRGSDYLVTLITLGVLILVSWFYLAKIIDNGISVWKCKECDKFFKFRPSKGNKQTRHLQDGPNPGDGRFVGNTKTDKYHYPDCRFADSILIENEIWFEDAQKALRAGYIPCNVCKPPKE